MRVWGRIPYIKTGVTWSEVTNTFSADTNTWIYGGVSDTQSYTWVEVDTDADGYNDGVMLTAFCQVLQLQPGESPFYAEYGVPSIAAVQSQTFPDSNVYLMQQRYAPNFVSLIVIPSNTTDVHGTVSPVYNVTAITHIGSIISATVAI